MGDLRLVFYLAGAHPRGRIEAGWMMASARRVMDCWVVQHTDLETEVVEGVDEVVRLDRVEPMVIHRYRLNATERGEFLSVDTDELFLEDVRGVFGKEFDVALARNEWSVHPVKVGRQLYNGAVFCRNPGFWEAALEDVQKKTWGPGGNWRWKYGDRSLTTASRQVRTLDLDARLYNYQPMSAGDDIYGRRILHFKAWRKEFMKGYYETYAGDRVDAGNREKVSGEGKTEGA